MNRVLHYLYGLPPVRGGGLIKYALDLAEKEKELGKEVILLAPGAIHKRNSSHVSVECKGKWNGVTIYKIINPLPIPMANGIQDIEWFTSDYGFDSYIKFLQELRPDVIHVHSLMGIHKSFFGAARELKIKIVYTSHDYFGICPKTDYIRNGQICTQKNWGNCGECCLQAFGTMHMILDQSTLFQKIMGLRGADLLLQKLIVLKKCLGKINRQTAEQTKKIDEKRCELDYSVLERYYEQIWMQIDVFHFNSEVAEQVFSKKINNIQSVLLPICNSNCKDNRKIRQFSNKIRIGFLGNGSICKGFSLLQQALERLWNEGKQFEVKVYFDEPFINAPYIKQNRPYKVEQLSTVLEEIDLLVVPSIWKETFGLVVLEALSYGVPVITTENVGAKILLEKTGDIGAICRADVDSLYKCLKNVMDKPDILKKWNKNICDADLIFDMTDHAAQVIEKCYGGT